MGEHSSLLRETIERFFHERGRWSWFDPLGNYATIIDLSNEDGNPTQGLELKSTNLYVPHSRIFGRYEDTGPASPQDDLCQLTNGIILPVGVAKAAGLHEGSTPYQNKDLLITIPGYRHIPFGDEDKYGGNHPLELCASL